MLLSLAPMMVGSAVVATEGVAAGASRPPFQTTPPDLQILVPVGDISIGTNPSTGDPQLQFTHITWDAGTGPFVIKPHFSRRTGTATFKQVIYKSRGGGAWRPAFSVALTATGVFDPPSDYRYPLTRFTLDHANPDGSPGAVVATSPKSDYCITADAFVGGVPNTPNQTSPPQSDCSDPRKALGFSVGWGDQYDQTDNGQPIDILGIPDGMYVLQATVDPQHLFTESNPDNNVVDTLLQLSGGGTTVTVISQTGPGSNGPNVFAARRLASRSRPSSPPTSSVGAVHRADAVIVNPSPGQVVSGPVPVAARVAPGTAPGAVQFVVDGHPLGGPVTSAPYATQWDTATATAGNHVVGAVVSDPNGARHAAPSVDVVVHNPAPPMTCFVLQAHVGAQGRGAVTTPAIHTASTTETLLALVARHGASATVTRPGQVHGGGLAWRLVRFAHATRSAAEIWAATTHTVLSHLRVTSTAPDSRDTERVGVVALEGVTGAGASSEASGASGAPALGLTTSGGPSLVFAVGASDGAGRFSSTGWVGTDSWPGGGGRASWSAYTNQPALGAGSVITVPGPASTRGPWVSAAVELVGDGN